MCMSLVLMLIIFPSSTLLHSCIHPVMMGTVVCRVEVACNGCVGWHCLMMLVCMSPNTGLLGPEPISDQKKLFYAYKSLKHCNLQSCKFQNFLFVLIFWSNYC